MKTTTTVPHSQTRRIGDTGIETSALGLGCWPIGGEMYLFGKSDSYGKVDDAESIRAIRSAIDEGVRFFDTADCYGAGHSERILGKALQGIGSEIVVSTKCGYVFDPVSKNIHGEDTSPAYIRSACEASLRRLGRDTIDLFHIHNWTAPRERIDEILAAMESLRADGLIRAYGWSTENVDTIEAAVANGSMSVLQHEYSVFHRLDPLLDLCRAHGLGSIVKSPLAMGLLGGRYARGSSVSPDDARGSGHDWVRYFKNGQPVPEFLERLDAIRDLLRSDGRTLAQGAIAYIWGKSEISIPIPGFKSVRQAVENAQALRFGPLAPECIAEIDRRMDELILTPTQKDPAH